ncbi:hypothetical protein H4P12_16610 [Paracoccus sp. 11-3]|uniref:Uncharacterized protein n=1 Tax=Paracoccus amoyensis TaxID=2760093 RepID=A0A926G9E1_9RHOB|nr:hypothetical protein [Paracoccus amoyensis]MBC9248293.1 hypothetical protein [Paracoccus amoyensis]
MNTELEVALRIRQETLEQLRQHDGREWKEAAGELHSQFHEIPSWILLFEDSDIKKCHEAFFHIVSPYFDQLPGYDFTVKYIKINDGEEIFLDFCADNEEILNAVRRPDRIGQRPIREPRADLDTFKSVDSRR